MSHPPPDHLFHPGDCVIKNPLHWVPSEFDGWGRGLGIGVVVEGPFDVDGEVDVRWPAGRCFEPVAGLLRADPPRSEQTSTTTNH